VSTRGAVIAGIGATEFSKDSGRSEQRLAAEAILSACRDARVDPHEVDGLVTFTMDNNRAPAVARMLGLRSVTLIAETMGGGGGGCGTVALAVSAVEAGVAHTVVCYRAMNERSQQRLGQARAAVWDPNGLATSNDLEASWNAPHGLATPAAYMALNARRYMHEYGATSEDFGRVAVASRAWAATNPTAWFYQRPITLEEHQQSRLVADPIRLLDCCQETDGAVAILVTTPERAADLGADSVAIAGAAQGLGADLVGMGSLYRDDPTSIPDTVVVGEQLWHQSGAGPEDVDVAIIYDHFTPAVLMQLEALGFCARGEAKEFIADGAIQPGGRFPLNTNGGQLGEGYIHGFNGIAEAVRQLRQQAVNQVPGARTAIVTSGSHVPTSGLLLRSVQ
jgi:acetyl-CoA acetyltransferase